MIILDIIETEFKSVQFKTIAADFTEGESIYPKIQAELAGLKIGILINNVGMLTDFAQNFHAIDEVNVRGIVNCNIMSMARMCHMILPHMVRRKSGVIINIGSIAGTSPTPLLTIYGATKVIIFNNTIPIGFKVSFMFKGFCGQILARSGGRSSSIGRENSHRTARLRENFNGAAG